MDTELRMNWRLSSFTVPDMREFLYTRCIMTHCPLTPTKMPAHRLQNLRKKSVWFFYSPSVFYDLVRALGHQVKIEAWAYSAMIFIKMKSCHPVRNLWVVVLLYFCTVCSFAISVLWRVTCVIFEFRYRWQIEKRTFLEISNTSYRKMVYIEYRSDREIAGNWISLKSKNRWKSNIV